MRGSISALVVFTIASVALGAAVAVVVLKDKSIELHAAFSSAVATAIIGTTYTPTTTSVVLEMNPLWTINTVKPETIMMNIKTDHSTSTAAVDSSPTIGCDHDWCQDSISIRTHRPGFTGRDPASVPIPSDPVTSLGNSTAPILAGDHEVLKTLNKKEFSTSAPVTLASASIDCKYKYCDDRIQYCMYWAGVTGWDPSLGPVPGMTRTTLGACQVPATEFTTNGGVQTTAAPTKKRVCSTRTTSF